MDKLAVIRSIVGLRDEHSSFQSMTGFPMGSGPARGAGRTSARSIARVQGAVDPVVPPFIDLSPLMQHKPYNTPGPGFLGQAYRPARMDGDDLALLRPPADVPRPRFDRPQGPARPVRPVPPLASTAPRSTAWTASTAAPSTC